jgi:uncharacterized SAM-binding protein YcdF (DUF218 family)
MRLLKTFSSSSRLLYVVWAGVAVYTFAQKDETRPADAAIVLGAAVFGERPSPVLRERINHAIGLYQAGTVRMIIFTGGQGDPGEATEADVAAAYAIAHGVPAAAILRETTSTNTWQNLAYAQEIAAPQELESFLIVSTPFHMRRALAIADDLGLEAYSSPTRTIQWISWATKLRAYGQEVGSFVWYRLVGSVG